MKYAFVDVYNWYDYSTINMDDFLHDDILWVRNIIIWGVHLVYVIGFLVARWVESSQMHSYIWWWQWIHFVHFILLHYYTVNSELSLHLLLAWQHPFCSSVRTLLDSQWVWNMVAVQWGK